MLADALDYIVRLRGRQGLEKGRATAHWVVCKSLRAEVPELYLVDAGAAPLRLVKRSWIPSPAVMASAAAGWIGELKARRDRDARFVVGGLGTEEGRVGSQGRDGRVLHGHGERNGVAREVMDKEGSERLVVKWLDKMEQWFELWESGQVQVDVGDSMSKCIELPE